MSWCRVRKLTEWPLEWNFCDQMYLKQKHNRFHVSNKNKNTWHCSGYGVERVNLLTCKFYSYFLGRVAIRLNYLV